MPTYRRNSRQWAQAKVDELNQIKRVTGKNTERELQEHSELIEGLLAGIYPDDPNPVYSAEELEAAGQTTLDW
jgi:hypothetical protein